MIIVADANLPSLSQAFPEGFDIITFENKDDLKNKIRSADILICRSTLTVDQHLISGTKIKLVATATSGTNHIDTSLLSRKNIPLVTAKGANASAVSDWALSVLAHVQSQLSGNCLGIIGLGHVGTILKDRLSLLNYEVLTCDPLISNQPNFVHSPLDELRHCDVLFVHANLHNKAPYPSSNLINKTFLKRLNPRCFIVNASRGGIVNEADILNTEFRQSYSTDVYENEPNINAELINNALICTPHIAGHTIEAKINAVFQVSEAIHRLYNRTAPCIEYRNSQTIIDLSARSWSKTILKHYDPMVETLALKSAKDKHTAFLELRQAHRRHGLLTS